MFLLPPKIEPLEKKNVIKPARVYAKGILCRFKFCVIIMSSIQISAVEINFFGNMKSIIKMQLDNSEKIILMMLIIFEVLNEL